MDNPNLIEKATKALHDADKEFEQELNQYASFIRDYFLPNLEDIGLTICEIERTHKCDTCGRVFRDDEIATNDDKTWVCMSCICYGIDGEKLRDVLDAVVKDWISKHATVPEEITGTKET